MNSAGGFLFDASQSIQQAGPSSLARSDQDQDEDESDTLTIRKLTSKQEIRLMNYLDEAFLQINRGFNKRHSSRTSSVPTLDSFIRAYDSILIIVASIPPVGPSASLLVSYLLRYTNEILDGIAGYDIASQASNDDDEEDKEVAMNASLDEQLYLVVQSLGLLDRVWSCVLRGQMVDLKAIKKNIESNSQDFDNYFPFQNGDQEADSDGRRVAEEAAGLHTSGRFPPVQPSTRLREGKSFVGSKGFSTVAQTNRIRLRNVITLAKENLFSWMRVQLDVPLPPRVGDDDEEEEGEEDLYGLPGDAEAHQKVEEGDSIPPAEVKSNLEEGEEDLEEVNTGGRTAVKEEDVTNDKSIEHTHYDDLFSRKIDPDALDSDEEEQSQASKRSRSPSQSPSPSKHQKVERETSPPTSSHLPDTESVATFSGTAAVMKWDLKFARLFAHSLRCLSDIQEHTNHREAAKAKSGVNEDGG